MSKLSIHCGNQLGYCCNFVLIADTEDGKKDPADTVSGGAVYVLDKDSNIK